MILAQELVGQELVDGWKVTKKVKRSENSTGGHFSISYLVENETGETGFLKAVDLSPALEAEDVLEALDELTETVNFEKDILDLCNRLNIKNVIKVIGNGNYRQKGFTIPVPYFIFEKAEGDIREQIDFKTIDIYLFLTILHNITNGLWKLHQNKVTHQDVKPSNILVFHEDLHKITDFGRSNCEHIESPHDHLIIRGDRTYAPPESLYGHVETEWAYRNQATDFYQLGSLLVFLFTQLRINTILEHFLDSSLVWYNSGKPYELVLPYVQEAFNKSVNYFKSTLVNCSDELKNELEVIVRQLCNPDPKKRGNPKYIGKPSTLNLESYVGKFDRLRRKQLITIK